MADFMADFFIQQRAFLTIYYLSFLSKLSFIEIWQLFFYALGSQSGIQGPPHILEPYLRDSWCFILFDFILLQKLNKQVSNK